MNYTDDLVRQHLELLRSGELTPPRASHHPAVTLRELQHRRKRRQINRSMATLSSFWQPRSQPVRQMTGVRPIRAALTFGLEALHRA